MAKQLLLIEKPKNFHIMLLDGKPAGSYSLRKYCSIVATIEHDIDPLQGWDEEKYKKGEFPYYLISKKQAIKKKIIFQKALLKAFESGLISMRPAWLKQRRYWRKMKKTILSGEKMTVNYE